MAVAVTGTPIGTTGVSVNSLTFSYTNPADGNCLIVFTGTGHSSGSGDATSGTFNGDTLTALSGFSVTDSNWVQTEAWYRLAPDVATGNVVMNFNAVTQGSSYAFSLTDVHQTTPFGTAATATGSSTTASVGVASGSSDLVIGSLMSDSEAGVTEGGTLIFESAAIQSDTVAAGQRYAGTGGTVTVSWTQSNTGWACGGVAVKPTGGGAAATYAGADGCGVF